MSSPSNLGIFLISLKYCVPAVLCPFMSIISVLSRVGVITHNYWGHWGSQGSNSSSGSHTWWAVESGSNPRLGNSKMEFLPLLYLPKGRKATQLDFVPLPHPWTVALFPPPPTYPAVGPDCLLPLPIGSTAVSTCWYSSLCPHLLCIIP